MANLNEMTVKELRSLCGTNGLSKKGTKAELIDRLQPALSEAKAEAKAEYEGRFAVLESIGTSNAGDTFAQVNGVIELGIGATATFTYKTSPIVRKVLPLCTYQIVNDETGEVFSYVIARDLGIKKASDDGLRIFSMDKINGFRWTGKFVKAVEQYVYPAKNELAGKKPIPVYRISTERGRKDEINTHAKRGYGPEPVFLSRPMFKGNGNATPEQEPPQMANGYSW